MSTNKEMGHAFQRVVFEFNEDSNTSWEPNGRSGHSMVADEGNIYLFGGYNPHGNGVGASSSTTDNPSVLVELWKFNIATSKWTNLTSGGIPDTCASSCLVLHGKKLYIYGGTSYPFGEMISNSVKVCDISNVSIKGNGAYWYLLETNPNVYNCLDSGDNMPPRAFGQSLILHNDCLYTFGGAVGVYDEAVNDLHRLICRTLTWEKLSPSGDIPSGRYSHEVAVYNGRLFIFGGGRLDFAESLTKIYAYDFESNSWEEIKTTRDRSHGYPCARCSFGLVQVEEFVYICGGRFYSDTVPHEALSDIWKFSLKSFRWQELPVVLPEPLYFHSAVISPCYDLHIYGGVRSVGGVRSCMMFRWRIPYHVPKLMELAWSTVTNNMKNCDKLSQETLELKYGIPYRLVERLY